MENGKCNNADKAIGFATSKFSTIDEWKTWLQSNPITVAYELAEPSITPLTAEQIAEFKKLYTFDPITNVLADGNLNIQYYNNTKSGNTIAMLYNMSANKEIVSTTEPTVQNVGDYWLLEY